LFKKPNFDHEADREADSTSNLELSRIFRYSRSFHYAPFLITGLHPTFSVLKTGLFEQALKANRAENLFFCTIGRLD